MPGGKDEIDINRVLFASDFANIREAIAADIVSGIPIIGEITDFLRVTNADTKRKRSLQFLDALTDPIPILGQITFTNTLLHLDKEGKIDLKVVDNILEILQLPKRR